MNSRSKWLIDQWYEDLLHTATRKKGGPTVSAFFAGDQAHAKRQTQNYRNSD